MERKTYQHEMTKDFIKELVEIRVHDWSNIEYGTHIFNSSSHYPDMWDVFKGVTKRYGQPCVVYWNPIQDELYTLSQKGWYFWDEDVAMKYMSKIIETENKEEDL